MDIEQTDHLIAYFTDVCASRAGAGAGRADASGDAREAAGPRKPVDSRSPGPRPKEPAKPAQAAHETQGAHHRHLGGAVPGPEGGRRAHGSSRGAERAGAAAGVKYQLEKAHCEGMVSVHQDPEDPTKPRGTDILGSLMIIDSTPDGSVLTVFGWDNRPGEVHNEGTSLIGPKIVVDQLHNLAVIEGRGSVAMPSSSGLTGAELKTAEPVVIHFRDGMTFRGRSRSPSSSARSAPRRAARG